MLSGSDMLNDMNKLITRNFNESNKANRR